jgi:putative proteasome-type protease
MTYCLATRVRDGMTFVSDSRTNAGVDQLSTFSKMHVFGGDGQRLFVLLSAGNLATTQNVVSRLRRDIRDNAKTNLLSIPSITEVAEYVGKVSRVIQEKHAPKGDDSGFDPQASFILGGQIQGQHQRLFMIYPEGNFMHTTERTPYLQIGETKYGKPILDRIVGYDTDLETAARCGVVSMDSTMRSNATVGPPIEVLIYNIGTQIASQRFVFEEDSDYLSSIRSAWDENLRNAFATLPKITVEQSNIRLVDG